MLFPLRVDKTIQAIGVLFRADHTDRMSYMRLLKLLYIADRESLRDTGRPITGGSVVAMVRGPVLEEVYDLIRDRHTEMPLWQRYLRREHYQLRLVEMPDVGKLSAYEIDKLQEVAARFAEHDEWELSQHTHEFPEWQKNNPNGSSKPIRLADILEAVGRQEQTAAIQQDAAAIAVFDRLLGG